jgi:hypothetical protein
VFGPEELEAAVASTLDFWLTSPKLPKETRLQPGDEVITVAAGFPTILAFCRRNDLCPGPCGLPGRRSLPPRGSRPMSITIQRTGAAVQVLEGAHTVPEVTPVQLFTAAELQEREQERRAMLDLRMPSLHPG